MSFTYWPIGELRTTVVDDSQATKFSMEYDKLAANQNRRSELQRHH